jgi:hypothetical protein
VVSCVTAVCFEFELRPSVRGLCLHDQSVRSVLAVAGTCIGLHTSVNVQRRLHHPVRVVLRLAGYILLYNL